ERVPGAQVLLQLDEPALPAVLAGNVPTASGLNRLPAPEETDAGAGLRAVADGARVFIVVHCCAPGVPFGMIKTASVQAVGVDLSLLRRDEEGGLAESVEAGLGILAGAVPATAPSSAERDGARPPEPAATARRVGGLWRRVGRRAPARSGDGSPGGGPVAPDGLAGHVRRRPGRCRPAGGTDAGLWPGRRVARVCAGRARTLPGGGP